VCPRESDHAWSYLLHSHSVDDRSGYLGTGIMSSRAAHKEMSCTVLRASIATQSEHMIYLKGR
jgi:hypothetical protein